MGWYYYFGRTYSNARNQVKRVVSHKTLPNGSIQEKVVTDMDNLKGNAFNLVGFNLNSGYGNFVHEKSWEMSREKIMEPSKALRRKGANIVETSCDESDSKLVQRIDDDKIELMCLQGFIDLVDGAMGRLGQVRSPFDVQLEEKFENEERKNSVTIDGESYILENAKSLTFQIDKDCPKLKVLTRTDTPNFTQKNK